MEYVLFLTFKFIDTHVLFHIMHQMYG